VQIQLEQQAQAQELKHLINGLQEFAFKNGLEEADFSLRRQIIRTLVKQIEVGHEKVNIVYRITPSQSITPHEREEDSLQHCKRASVAHFSKHIWAPVRAQRYCVFVDIVSQWELTS
jgi:hypothetical protein